MAQKKKNEENIESIEELDEKDDSKKSTKYCSNCGEKLDAIDKFCESCGMPVKNKKKEEKDEEEQEVIEAKKRNKKENGKVHKCPNCGSPLKSFESTCPYCQAEIREIKVSDSIEEFTKGLERIQSRPMSKYEENPSFLKKMVGKDFNKEDAKEKFEEEFEEKRTNDLVNYIINYPIPNSKEDLLEFMILSSFNVNVQNDSSDEVQKAWLTKMEQIVQKAKITIKNPEDLNKITELYEKKMEELRKKKIRNIIKIICIIMLYFLLFGFIANPIWTIIIFLLLISLVLFVYSILFEKKIINIDFKLSKRMIHLICCICVILSFVLFITNIVIHSNSSSKDNIGNEEVEKGIDYKTAEEFEKALNDGQKVKGKIVKFTVNSYYPDSILGINCWVGEHLNFISEEELDVKSGDTIIGKITKEPKKDLFGSWEIEYNVLSIEKQKEDKEENKEEEKDKTEGKNEQQRPEDNSENSDTKPIIMIVLPEEYIGSDAKDIEAEMKDLGYTNIVLVEKETTDAKNKDGTIFEFSIAGKQYERGDVFNSSDEVKISYWKYVGKKLDKIVLPKAGSKLEKDFDPEMTSENTRYYFNIDGVKNTPKLKKYENTTITDGVYEYLEYLKSLGYQIEITDVDNKEPYKGFHTYDTNFKVYSNDISWTMYLGIQDEKYIEYEFDINLK